MIPYWLQIMIACLVWTIIVTIIIIKWMYRWWAELPLGWAEDRMEEL